MIWGLLPGVGGGGISSRRRPHLLRNEASHDSRLRQPRVVVCGGEPRQAPSEGAKRVSQRGVPGRPETKMSTPPRPPPPPPQAFTRRNADECFGERRQRGGKERGREREGERERERERERALGPIG